MKTYSDVRAKARVQTFNDEESKTIQSDRQASEIHHILSRYRETGILERMRSVDLQFRDITEFSDYADALRQHKDAEAVFMQLPSKVREVFEHSVDRWLDAAHDPEKLDALRPRLERIGAVEPLPSPAPDPDPAPVPPVSE